MLRFICSEMLTNRWLLKTRYLLQQISASGIVIFAKTLIAMKKTLLTIFLLYSTAILGFGATLNCDQNCQATMPLSCSTGSTNNTECCKEESPYMGNTNSNASGCYSFCNRTSNINGNPYPNYLIYTSSNTTSTNPNHSPACDGFDGAPINKGLIFLLIASIGLGTFVMIRNGNNEKTRLT